MKMKDESLRLSSRNKESGIDVFLGRHNIIILMD